jgi:hypothetical protein
LLDAEAPIDEHHDRLRWETEVISAEPGQLLAHSSMTIRNSFA